MERVRKYPNERVWEIVSTAQVKTFSHFQQLLIALQKACWRSTSGPVPRDNFNEVPDYFQILSHQDAELVRNFFSVALPTILNVVANIHLCFGDSQPPAASSEYAEEDSGVALALEKQRSLGLGRLQLRDLLLVPDKADEVTLSALQCFAVLAAGFLCVWDGWYGDTPGVNFSFFYKSERKASQTQKLMCMLHYFNEMSTAIRRHNDSDIQEYTRIVTFRRLCQPAGTRGKGIDFGRSSVPLGHVTVFPKGLIEDSTHLQADFANKRIGGGVLGRGCVQEEILLITSPELLVARAIFGGELQGIEAALIIGARRLCNYWGYASSFRYYSLCERVEPNVVQGGRLQLSRYVVALDAVNVSGNPKRQFDRRMVIRELQKAFIAVDFDEGCEEKKAFATGNWGCGAFGGDLQLKSLLQWMACSLAGRAMHYYTFQERDLNEFANLVERVRHAEWTVGDMWSVLERINGSRQAFDQVKRRLRYTTPVVVGEKNKQRPRCASPEVVVDQVKQRPRYTEEVEPSGGSSGSTAVDGRPRSPRPYSFNNSDTDDHKQQNAPPFTHSPPPKNPKNLNPKPKP